MRDEAFPVSRRQKPLLSHHLFVLAASNISCALIMMCRTQIHVHQKIDGYVHKLNLNFPLECRAGVLDIAWGHSAKMSLWYKNQVKLL
jgi:hypothetical protein